MADGWTPMFVLPTIDHEAQAQAQLGQLAVQLQTLLATSESATGLREQLQTLQMELARTQRQLEDAEATLYLIAWDEDATMRPKQAAADYFERQE